jgi:exodeoxyribonuclease-5
MAVVLTKKQSIGLDIAVERYNQGEKYTVISGYAGTGKSTLVKFIVQALPVDPEDLVYATFTGKAAQVLLSKGNENAMTLHRLLYESIPRADGTFYRRKRKYLGYSVVIVDEVSMAPKDMMELLFSHYGVYVICLGDPFQLPPIDKNADNHLLDNPHVFLDEVMRQALDSDIIKLTMDIRNQKPIQNFKGKDVQVLDKSKLTTGMLLWADQIISGTNKTRTSVNNQMRDLLGRGKDPEDGDKVICLRNYWDYWADNGDYLVNGTLGFLDNTYSTFNVLPPWYGGDTIPIIQANFISDSNADYGSLQMDKKEILTGEKSLDRKLEFRLSRSKKFCSLIPMDFTYGYCITCHKAQGSQWNKVLVIEEKFPFDKEEHKRWLYTACTRGSEKVVLLR